MNPDYVMQNKIIKFIFLFSNEIFYASNLNFSTKKINANKAHMNSNLHLVPKYSKINH